MHKISYKDLLRSHCEVNQNQIAHGMDPVGLGDTGYLVELILEQAMQNDQELCYDKAQGYASALQTLAPLYAAEMGSTLIIIHYTNFGDYSATIKGDRYKFGEKNKAAFFKGIIELYGDCIFL